MKQNMNRFEHGGDVWHGNPEDWLDFSSNINALGCPDFVQKALQRAMDEVAYYPQVNMQHAATGLGRMLGLPKACILPTNGGIGALDLAITKTKPQRIIAVGPAFVEYERIAVQNDIPFVHVSMLASRQTAAFPIYRLKSVIKEGDMLIVCNPSNPIGFGTDRNTMLQALELAASRNALLLVDEAFTLFCHGLSVRDLVQQYENVIIAGSLTKLFAIPGVRIGYLLAGSDTISALRAYQTPWALSAFGSRAAGAAGEAQAFIQRTVEETAKARQKLKALLEALGLYVFESRTNYLLTDLKPARITAADLADKLRKRRILVRNCENYNGLDTYHMRVAVKNENDNQTLVAHISAILQGSA